MPEPRPGPVTPPDGPPVLRFAPSPNGRLHLGHAYSALLNARLAERLGGRCLLRIEDIDPGRSRPELIAAIQADLAWLGLRFEGPVRRQSEHVPKYARAVGDLAERGLAYPCFCSRSEIAARVAEREVAGVAYPRDPDGAPLYPGTCRGLPLTDTARRRAAGEPHTWRLDMARALAAAPGPYRYRCFGVPPESDHGAPTLPPLRGRVPAERAGEGTATSPDTAFPSPDPRSREGHPPPQRGEGVRADPSRWGDAVIARRDVPTSYHLSAVLDDDAQGITHVVRGEDLRAATDLHVLLQRLLGLESPAYHHHGLILGEDGRKLAKSKGSESLAALRERGVSADEIRARLGFP